MRSRFFLLHIITALLLAGLLLGGCANKTASPPTPRPSSDIQDVKEHYKDTVRGRNRAQTPTIPADAVIAWMRGVKFPGFKQTVLDRHFQPIDGNLMATYQGKGGKILYLSYVDDGLKDPDFGLKREAHAIVSQGAEGPVTMRVISGRRWYGDDSSGPIAATDAGSTVRIVLTGLGGLSLEDLFDLAGSVPMDSLSGRLP